ncbi:hypothetical protein CVT24_008698 [Panaeolus cyanescens]|uniref:Uncharacterized protein n=1 Tax=Panaeolus cyanescens TaxID=181874 RepID=A0A409VKJ0_9AGAR|nr:hypothetical protein CVT24_008698 [Panaeolus cyanescens]
MPVDTLPIPHSSSAPSLSIRSFRSLASQRSASSRNPKKPASSRVPHPSHRHAAPSAPWPWVDLEDEVDRKQLDKSSPPIPKECLHGEDCNNCWTGYPQSRFPNWTPRQVKKSKIFDAIHNYNRDDECVLYQVDVDNDGFFSNGDEIVVEDDSDASLESLWRRLINYKRPPGNRVRAIFLHNTSGPVLQMLGTKFNIEPFFWSSSLNWIPSRFQEAPKEGEGDHITLTLTFVRSMTMDRAEQLNNSTISLINTSPSTLLGMHAHPYIIVTIYSYEELQETKKSTLMHLSTLVQVMFFVCSMELCSDGRIDQRLLVLDLLAVHLVRNVNGNTIISYHPTNNKRTTQAKYLHERIRFAGQSVYWQNIFQNSEDPTFLLLAFIWHAIYAWDQALEDLYGHISYLETRVMATTEMRLTHELHTIRAHHLHYTSLLDDFSKHVTFVRDTSNPALQGYHVSERDRMFTKNTMDRECSTLLGEIKRLQTDLMMQERRLKNVMGLVFSSVNITDSRYMREMTEAAVRDSAAMKQVAYLTMVFLPASFVAGVFGMNVEEINPGTFGTLPHYLAVALPLTLLTAWIIIAFQSTYLFEAETHFLLRLGWPVYLIMKYFGLHKRKPQEEVEDEDEKNNEFSGITVEPPADDPLLPTSHPPRSPFQR